MRSSVSEDVVRSTDRDVVPLGKDPGSTVSMLCLLDAGPSLTFLTSLLTEFV